MNVIVDSGGFNDLLNRLNDLRAVERRNAETVQRVVTQRKLAVTAQATRLTAIEGSPDAASDDRGARRARPGRAAAAVDRRPRVRGARARGQTASRLMSLRKTLTHEAGVLSARAAAAGALPASGGARRRPARARTRRSSPMAARSVSSRRRAPTTASAKSRSSPRGSTSSGRALHLHLIGISGYRSPAHSLEVGGFADDPHTKGDASDTPGVEGVPEATLQKFCLTRPFAGAAEADHIQLS